jgi:DNA-binding NtrC family response regulator
MGAQVPGFKRKNLSPGARSLLQSHPWPGNVRELMSTVRRAAIWTDGPLIRSEDARRALLGSGAAAPDNVLHRPLDAGLDLGEILGEVSRHYIARALESSSGVKKEAAKQLGFANAQTLTNWMKRYGIKEA